jgi:hypothetical protein
MLEFHKQADGTWKRFGEAVPEEEPVIISFSNSRVDPPYRYSLSLSSVPTINAPEPDKVKHSGAVEGEFSWAEAIRIVEEMIHDEKVGGNLCQIQSAMYRKIEDAFALAQRDPITRHPEWLQSRLAPVPPSFHKYSIDICRPSDGQAIMGRVGSLELVKLISDRLRQRFSGRICDPAGNVLEEWTVE